MSDGKRGLFIVFEGLDGSGKTTQARMLLKAMYALEPLPCGTAEPDGQVPLGLLGLASPEEQALWFAYNRLEHVRTLIEPRLAAGNSVICDRYVLSSLAYQVADGVPLEWVREINKFAPEPDLTVFLVATPMQCKPRIKARDGQELSLPEIGRLYTVSDNYYWRVAELPADKVLIVDGTQDKDAIHAQILARVKELMG